LIKFVNAQRVDVEHVLGVQHERIRHSDRWAPYTSPRRCSPLLLQAGLWGSLQFTWVQYELETTSLVRLDTSSNQLPHYMLLQTFEKLLFVLLPVCSSVVMTWSISCFEDATNLAFYFCIVFYVNYMLFVIPAPSSFLRFTRTYTPATSTLK
jgi:hypothetical protein